jgi:hypothetical protein
MKTIIAGVFTLCCGFRLFASLSGDSLSTKKRISLSALPVVFYTPETRFGFGASGILLFNFKNDTLQSQKSSVNIGFAYTQNKQVLFYLPFNLFVNNRAYQFYGEAGYNKFFYNFYGVGNEQPENFVEKYGVEFPRLRITAIKKIARGFYMGPRYAYDKFSLSNLDSAGQLIRGKIPGSKGGTVSGFGLVTVYDTRDYVFYPSKGMWAELVIYRDANITGSTFNYTRIAFDASKYFNYKKNILALNAYSIFSDTDVPFFQMGNLGGQKKMRGFYEGRYRDNNLLVFQAEYRRSLFWLLGMTVFGSVGQVAHRYDELNMANWRYTYGAGLRLMMDKNQKLNLRIDFAIGNNKLLPYFTIGEAF